MAAIYDARGNRYAVATPQQVREAGLVLPATADQAAANAISWTRAAITRFCRGDSGAGRTAKAHATDGLLIGPFQAAAPFDLLIVNTDGSLAERSGNGITIFAQSLMDAGLIRPGARFTVNVHHHGRDVDSPVSTPLTSAERNGLTGFWLDMGAPAFGAQAVGASGRVGETQSPDINHVPALEAVNPAWSKSIFVRLGNPHCVSLIQRPAALPDMAWLGSAGLPALTAIAFSSAGDSLGHGDPCPNGINLQWAAAVNNRHIQARVFERGEGPTLSSGTSACAVASALWKSGQVIAGDVEVEMPGGIAPVRLVEQEGVLKHVCLFGVAARLAD